MVSSFSASQVQAWLAINVLHLCARVLGRKVTSKNAAHTPVTGSGRSLSLTIHFYTSSITTLHIGSHIKHRQSMAWAIIKSPNQTLKPGWKSTNGTCWLRLCCSGEHSASPWTVPGPEVQAMRALCMQCSPDPPAGPDFRSDPPSARP